MTRKKTHEEYVAEVAIVNSDIEVVGKYNGNKIKIFHRCKIDGYEWMAIPTSILRGTGCPRCAGNERYGHEEYVKRVSEINPDIEVVGEYINNCTPILHRCKIDGHEWMARPNQILRGIGCPLCGAEKSADKRKKTHEQYVKDVEEINQGIEVVDEYIDDTTKILHKCKLDGYEWMAKPNNILHGKGCPRCAKVERYGHEGYVKRVLDINQNIEVVEEYVNDATKILHRCKIDGCVWSAAPNNILHGSGCPKCNTSKGENIIATWLNNNNIAYKPQETFDDCRDKKVLRFDFHLLDYGILIEYNGIQHYEPIEFFGGQEGVEGVVRRDKIKEDYCRNNNIPLIVIPYYADIYEELDKMCESIIAKEVAA